MIVCVHEDRPSALVGVQLLIASLGEHCPGLGVAVSAPGAAEWFRRWLEGFPQARLIDDPSLAREGWNAKPVLLRRMLQDGHDQAVWIDSDVIVRGDVRRFVEGAEPARIVCSQAQRWDVHQRARGGTLRTALWGLPVGRAMPWLISTGFVRVTGAHLDLLRTWERFLREPEYRRVQSLHQYQRPVHMIGDQDVFTALLGSEPFADIPVTYLRRGRDIVLSVGPSGYTLGERIGNLVRGLPPLIHTTGPKPWERRTPGTFRERVGAWYDRHTLEVGPYAKLARRYRDRIDCTPIVGVERPGVASRLALGASFGNPTLAGMPLCAFHSACKHVKHALRRRPWPDPESNVDRARQPDGALILREFLGAVS